jgi:putative membrane protein insertion efficiency factor
MMKWLAIVLIKAYRKWVSPRLPPGICEMEPSCSQYGLEAFQRHGFIVGFRLTLRRFFRCGRPNGDKRPLKQKRGIFWTMVWLLKCMFTPKRRRQTEMQLVELTYDPVPVELPERR